MIESATFVLHTSLPKQAVSELKVEIVYTGNKMFAIY